MNDPVKILSLEAENVKRVRAVKVEPTAAGLTIIGGDNNQGKTSVLDALAWALGGDRFRPSQAVHEGSAVPPYLKVTLSDGIIVERKGKNSALAVTDPSGKKAGQQLLNAFIEPLALDLPRFMQKINSNDQDAMNLYERVRRGDVDQCSFGFDILDEETEQRENGEVRWTIRKVKLYEVSVVTFPAYQETSVTARKRDYEEIQKRKTEAWRESMRKKLKE